MFLFKTGLSRVIRKLYLILRTNLLFQFVKIIKSLKDGILLQFKRWSRIAQNVKGDIPINFPDLTFKCLCPSHHNR